MENAFKCLFLLFPYPRETNINFYVADASIPVITTVKTLDDIGPEFNFTVKVHSMNPSVQTSSSNFSFICKKKK